MAAKKRTKTTETDNRSEAEKRDEQRKQFVAQKKAQGVSAKEANTQFYVQTRVKELTAKGVKVDAAKRQELRQNYQSGNVRRAGFGVTPASGGKTGSKSGGKSGSTSSSKPAKPNTRTGPETTNPGTGNRYRSSAAMRQTIGTPSSGFGSMPKPTRPTPYRPYIHGSNQLFDKPSVEYQAAMKQWQASQKNKKR